MGRDRAYCAVDFFDGTDQQAGKATEAETRFIDTLRTTCHQTGELPTQEDPGIEQDQTDTKQKETQGRIARSGGGTHTAEHAITAFDAETAPIFLVDFLDLPVESQHDKSQPFAASFASFVRDERSLQGQGCRGAIGEGMDRPITGRPLAQGADAFRFAADRAGNHGGLVSTGEKADDRCGGKTFVQVQHFARNPQLFQALEQKFKAFQSRFTRQHEAHCQSQTHTVARSHTPWQSSQNAWCLSWPAQRTVTCRVRTPLP